MVTIIVAAHGESAPALLKLASAGPNIAAICAQLKPLSTPPNSPERKNLSISIFSISSPVNTHRAS